MSNQPSICIPRVQRCISQDDILSIFNVCNFGKIRKINFAFKNNWKTVFIYFDYWYNNDNEYRLKLLAGENIYIGYFAHPGFWKCCQNKN